MGAYNATSSAAPHSGKAYVFTNSGSSWAQTILSPTSAHQGDGFGNRVIISGNGNTIVVGSYLASNTGSGIAATRRTYSAIKYTPLYSDSNATGAI